MLQLTTVTADIGVLPLGVGGVCMYVIWRPHLYLLFVCFLFPIFIYNWRISPLAMNQCVFAYPSYGR